MFFSKKSLLGIEKHRFFGEGADRRSLKQIGGGTSASYLDRSSAPLVNGPTSDTESH